MITVINWVSGTGRRGGGWKRRRRENSEQFRYVLREYICKYSSVF